MTEVTLSNVLKHIPKPTLPSFVTPEPFNPVIHDALIFLEKFEKCCILNAWSDVEKIFFFGGYLLEYAFVWYKNYKNNQLNVNKTWDTIVQDFKHEFASDSYLYKLRLKLREKKQGEAQDIVHFFHEILQMCYQLNSNMPDNEIIEFFESGLHSKYQYQYGILSEEIMNLSKLKSIVFKLHNAINREKLHSQRDVHKDLVVCTTLLPKKNNTSFKCHRCRKIGHTRKACKTKLFTK